MRHVGKMVATKKNGRSGYAELGMVQGKVGVNKT